MAEQPADEMQVRLGKAIRELRRQRRLTLVVLAQKTGLSHPFLSQLERGIARPSMNSLTSIAGALGTSAQALMSLRDDSPVSFTAKGSGVPVDHLGGTARSLVSGSRAVTPVEFHGGPSTFGDYFQHAGDEFLYVITGSVEVELVGHGLHDVGPGDCLYYAGGIAHRWRQTSRSNVRLLLTQENFDDLHQSSRDIAKRRNQAVID